MTADLATVGRLGAAEHWLAVVATTRADGSVHASLVNAGILDHPVTGEPTIGFVARGDARKLVHLRRTGHATVVFRSGWEWVAVDGPASICGPDDEMDGMRAGRAPGAVARRVPCRRWTHDDWDEYDRVMAADRRAVVFVAPARITGNA